MRVLSKPKQLTASFSSSALALGIALTGQQASAAGIKDTKHNLVSPSGINVNYVTDARADGQICVFCHTPHGSNTASNAPMWNKALDLTTNTFYTTYATLSSATMNGKVGKPGAISLVCLSCHDGAQAMDNVIKVPGSGNYDPTGGGSGGRGWTWSNGRTSAGRMINDTAKGTASMLGTDLSNDHPIGLEYCGGPIGGASVTTCRDRNFVRLAFSPGNETTGPWWVDTDDGIAGMRDKTDIILYPAQSDRTTGVGPQVECASCHDPHSTNGLFLRRKLGNTGNVTCLSCHVK